MKIKSIKDITLQLAKLEGEKVQIDIAQMTEVVRLLSAITYLHPESIALLVLHGKKVTKEARKYLK